MLPTGAPLVGATITYRLEPGAYTGVELYPPAEVVSSPTNSSGVCTATLWRNGESAAPARYQATLPGGDSFAFVIPSSSATAVLSALRLDSGAPAGWAITVQGLIDTHAAVKATTTVLGHVRVDGSTITATDGVITAVGGGGGGGGAPTDARYVTLQAHAGLSQERVLTAGDNVQITDGGAGSTVTVAVPSVPWGDVTGTPSTLAGYNIADAASDAELAAHESDTTNIHGIADTSALLTNSSSLNASNLGSGTVPTARLPAASTTASGIVELATSAETTAGLAVQASDTRLSDARTPTAHVHSGADITSGTVAAARLPAASTSAAGIWVSTMPTRTGNQPRWYWMQAP